MYELASFERYIVGKDLSDISVPSDAHPSLHSRRIRQSDGTTSVHTNPFSPFSVMYRQSCPGLWACSLEKLSFKLLHCGSVISSKSDTLSKTHRAAQSLDRMHHHTSNPALHTKV